MLREVLTVSALILAVLLVRAIFKNRVPKRMVYTLWLVVLVKLCLPGRWFRCRCFRQRKRPRRCSAWSCPRSLSRRSSLRRL